MEEQVALSFDYYDDVVKSDLGLEDFAVLDPQDLLDTNFISSDLDETWVKNYTQNKESITPCSLTTYGKDRVVILVGGSPAIEKNWEALKDIDDSFILVCCTTSLRFLLEHDLKPKFCVVVDAGEHIVKDIEGLDTKDIILISSPFASPKVLAMWEGEIRHYILGGGEKYKELIEEDWKGRADIDIGGGNVLSTAYLWAYKYLNCRNFIVCGMSLCYYDDYYLEGREHGLNKDGSKGKFFALDMNGVFANCTVVLWMYKTWLETYVRFGFENRPDPGTFINATEDGILGVMPEIIETDGLKMRVKPTHVPWITVVPLEVAVEGHKLRFKEK